MKMKGNQLKMRVNKKKAKVKKKWAGSKKIKRWPAEIGRGGTPAPRNQRPLPLILLLLTLLVNCTKGFEEVKLLLRQSIVQVKALNASPWHTA